MATRRNGKLAMTVVLVAHIVGFLFMVALAPLFELDASGRDLWWGGVGGLAGVVGLVLLYRGLAIGTMSVVAPITALGAAVLPVVFGLAIGERPASSAIVGAVVALAAIVLVSRPVDPTALRAAGRRWRDEGLAEAVGAGLGFGTFFIFLAETSPESGLVPLVSARAASVVVLAILVLVAGHSARFARPALVLVLAAGVFDAGANALFLGVARTGLLSLVAVLSALYPASTILSARVILGERIGRVQQVGLAAGLFGVVLIASA